MVRIDILKVLLVLLSFQLDPIYRTVLFIDLALFCYISMVLLLSKTNERHYSNTSHTISTRLEAYKTNQFTEEN